VILSTSAPHSERRVVTIKTGRIAEMDLLADPERIVQLDLTLFTD
jgi:hypothetical protein